MTDSTLTPSLIAPAGRRFTVSREIALALLTAALFVGASIRYNVSFPTTANLSAVLRNLVFEGIIAVGMMLLMVGGTFDLSVGAMASMAGVVTGYLLKHQGWPVPAAVGAGLGVGALGGLLNGFIVAKVRVNPLITTLGTMGVFKGVALLVGGPGVASLPRSFTRFGQSEFLGLQAPVWVLLALALAAHYCLAHTRYFRQYYYVGSNPKAAHLSGINVDRLQVLAFTLMGMLAALAGILYASRIATAVTTVGDGKELQAITAVILGGASLTGGRGTIWGAMLGVSFVALMNNILPIAGVRSELQSILLGVVLVAAVAVDSALNRKQHR